MTVEGSEAADENRRGLMLVISSPSGAGKTSICRGLVSRDSNLFLSVSVTTRPRRPSEVEGHDYYFIDEHKYQAMIEGGELLEWAHVFNHSYGTPRKNVEDMLSAGKDVLFDIDWQGAQQLAGVARQDLASVFILPPSKAELERRLRERKQDSDEVIATRMARASDEMSHWPEYDYVIVNTELDASVSKVESILSAERQKREGRKGIQELLEEMRANTSNNKEKNYSNSMKEYAEPNAGGEAVNAIDKNGSNGSRSSNTADQIRESARRRFVESSELVIGEISKAREDASAMIIVMKDMRLNTNEAAEVRDLLERQIRTLDSILVIFGEENDAVEAQEIYLRLLGEVFESLLKAIKNKSVMKGLIAAAALSVARIAGLELSALTQALIAGSIVGPEVINVVENIVKKYGKMDK